MKTITKEYERTVTTEIDEKTGKITITIERTIDQEIEWIRHLIKSLFFHSKLSELDFDIDVKEYKALNNKSLRKELANIKSKLLSRDSDYKLIREQVDSEIMKLEGLLKNR